MFPTRFADEVVSRFTNPGDAVLDPFAGRGTAVFSAAHLDRSGYGVEISPVGWIYADVKLRPAAQSQVVRRLRELVTLGQGYGPVAEELPEFFEWCFAPETRSFLVAAREKLDWRKSRVDRTLMAFLLVYLHGKRDSALSNQMRQTKAMAPQYAVQWWRERGMKPPVVDVLRFLNQRITWRYAKGVVETRPSAAYLGDCRSVIPRVRYHLRARHPGGVQFLLTSPPYLKVTNYHYDQWLRLWLLGGPATDSRVPGSHELQGRFEHRGRYAELLREVFLECATLLAPTAVVYVRTSASRDTFQATEAALGAAFPDYRLRCLPRPYLTATQTGLFGHDVPSVGEVDIVAERR
jgi:hypothetical protein